MTTGALPMSDPPCVVSMATALHLTESIPLWFLGEDAPRDREAAARTTAAVRLQLPQRRTERGKLGGRKEADTERNTHTSKEDLKKTE